MEKSPEAFRTISEVAAWLDTPAHVLRFWESRFTQIKPVKRAGGRRYYRPSDMMLLGGIKKLLHEDGLTIRGVQKILREEGVKFVASLAPPLDEETAGLLIEGEAEVVEEAAALSPGQTESAAPADADEAPEAPMQEEAEAEDAPVVALRPRPRPEPDEAILPGLDLMPAGTGTRPAAPPPAPAAPAPEAAPTPTFRRHAARGPAAPPPPAVEPPRPAPEVAPEPEPPAAEAAPGPVPAPEPAAMAPAEPPPIEAAPEPQAEPAPEPEPEPAPAFARPLGTGIARSDPADDDPAFAPIAPPLRTWIRSPALRKALAENRDAAEDAISRLRALSARMRAGDRGADPRG